MKLTIRSLETKRKELEELREKLRLNNKELGSTIETDSLRENQWLEQLRLQNESLRARISNLSSDISRAEIIKESHRKGIVNIDDTVKLRLEFDSGDCEESMFKLVDDLPPLALVNLEIELVTINSPIGSAIFQKPIGATEKVYIDGNNGYIVVTILNIMD